jgi:uncharacterized membrane protein
MIQPLIYYFLNDDELLRISNLIKKVEMNTAGEICVSIREKRKIFKRRKSIKDLAEEEFFRLGINRTMDKTGIIIFILLAEREFYLLADEGINKKVEQSVWDNIADKMHNYFVHGEFCGGILFGIEEAGKILAENFPVKPGDKNELSNRVIIK